MPVTLLPAPRIQNAIYNPVQCTATLPSAFPIKIPIRFISFLHTLILNTNVGLVIHYRSRLCFYYQQHPFRDFSLFPWPHLLPSMVMTNSVFLYDLFNSLYKISSTIQLSEAISAIINYEVKVHIF